MKDVLYCFYKLPEKELYAHTITKSFAKAFEDQRCMQNFYMKKVKINDDFEYKSFFRKNYEFKLTEIILEDSNGTYSIIGTCKEEDDLNVAVTELQDSIAYLRKYFLTDTIFKKKYAELIDEIALFEELDDFHAKSVVDTFHLFYRMFQNTFKDQGG